MTITAMAIALMDNGGRRLGIDRRQFLYTSHIPDKRMNEDEGRRTIGVDRRDGLNRRGDIGRRIGKVIILKSVKDLRKIKDRRSDPERRAIFSAALAT